MLLHIHDIVSAPPWRDVLDAVSTIGFTLPDVVDELTLTKWIILNSNDYHKDSSCAVMSMFLDAFREKSVEHSMYISDTVPLFAPGIVSNKNHTATKVVKREFVPSDLISQYDAKNPLYKDYRVCSLLTAGYITAWS